MKRYILIVLSVILYCNLTVAQNNSDITARIAALDKKLTAYEAALQQANERIRQQDEIIASLQTQLSETQRYVIKLGSALTGSHTNAQIATDDS